MNQPTPPPPPPPSFPTGGAEPPSQRSFFARLFDLSFSEFITPSIIKIIYLLGIVMASIMGLVVLVAASKGGGIGVVIGLIVGSIVTFGYILMARVVSELYLIMFRIEENTRRK